MEYVKCPITHQQILADDFESHIRRRFPDWVKTDLVQNVLKEIDQFKKQVEVKEVPKTVVKETVKKEITQIPKNTKGEDSVVNVKTLTEKEVIKNE